MAGPIVAAAIWSRGFSKEKKILAKVKDSKLLTAKQREALFVLITGNFSWTVHAIGHKYIDRFGIQLANVRVVEGAMKKLLLKEKIIRPKIMADYVGGAKKYLSTKIKIDFYKHGDSIFPEISAASIVAKVYRDRLMNECHKKYSSYGFNKHKGYGTPEHLAKIKSLGPCDIHRRSFLVFHWTPLSRAAG